MSYSVSLEFHGESRSFPDQQSAFATLAADRSGTVLVLAGDRAGQALAGVDLADKVAVLVELGAECLGVYTGEQRGGEGSNCLGFARFRLGRAEPSNLIELVRQPTSDDVALAAAREVFETAGFRVAVCADRPGRIIDRLVRPLYNAVLRRLDEGLASADDLDTCLRLGLGYPEGPIGLLERTGLSEHYEVSRALFEALGETAYVPARRAQVAHHREGDAMRVAASRAHE